MSVDPQLLARIAARHGHRAAPLPDGESNHVYRLGPDLVLRIPRADPADLRKEAAVLPVVRAAGIPAPDLVAYDPELPYLIVTWVPGSELSLSDPAALRALGPHLALLHQITAAIPGVPVDAPGRDPRLLADHLATTGHLDADSARWLTAWFDRLDPHRPPFAPVLVHGDLSPQNLVTHNGSTTLIDWGDAAFADPAAEFAKLPLQHLGPLLETYLPRTADRTGWAARVLWHHLSWALGRLRDPAPRPGARHWSGPPYARLLGLLRFLAGSPPEPWRSLLPNRCMEKH